ncbi:anaerobic ribonucleoside-triphosphate reductase activating protein [Candidatus Gracilibacteria bacterium]|nr:anaerobic ribonucleoside-triphosphate reductase activating protein [Candidatus Gracilibacteria bacterium]MCF7856220.1 anaerobic ribonucleoside-triphosphate reductase activating protein [Candidatus Gracilibacteria bacterium]MCF7896715.1 anaerobic ribonucleoside-triphosphate reductase activating protein [Candidatus Gracilibacteria bacterium]
MQIAAIQKLTLLDFPTKTACTVFTLGCNFRCGYCHNPELVLPEKFPSEMMLEDDLFAFLAKRKGMLDGVCVTGGEPTLQKDLPEFLKQIRKRGFLVKLDTNGSRPDVLEKLFKARLLDYVALDVKSSPEGYEKLVGLNQPSPRLRQASISEKVQSSKNLIVQSGVPYEFRTTLVREIHDEKEFAQILEFVRGAEKYFLQNFVGKQGCLDSAFEKMHGFTNSELKKMCEEAKEFVRECGVRN